MFRKRTLLIFLASFLALLPAFANAAPSLRLAKKHEKTPTKTDVENSLEDFLNMYYNKYLKTRVEENLMRYVEHPETKKPKVEEVPREKEEYIYEEMQGDQPATNEESYTFNILPSNYTQNNFTEIYIETMRNRLKNDVDERTRDNWIQVLKNNILQQIGRSNVTASKIEDPRLEKINMSDILPILNNSNFFLVNDDHVTEKIRSFYPSCEIPMNTDQEMWKDDDIMNLYFNFDHSVNTRYSNIASATLRLYRIPGQNKTKSNSKKGDCNENTEEEKLLRVSVYWYTKSLKKKRVKRRLSDSKVVAENARWVELSAKPATKAWMKAKNLGLGILVEDQEGNTLRADKYFKGASCMQHPNPSPRSSLMPPGEPTNWNEFIANWVETQRLPSLMTYFCSPQ